MAGRSRPAKPRTPRRVRRPLGAPAPPLGGVRREPGLASAPVVRAGALVMAALWEE